MNFKVGDKIKWIGKFSAYGDSFKNIFIKDKIYEVIDYYGPVIRGERNEDYVSTGWIEGSFELINKIQPFIIQKEEDYYTWLAKR